MGKHGPNSESLDTTPSVAQMNDYALGGEDNLAVDREVMQQLCAPAHDPRRFDAEELVGEVREPRVVLGIAAFLASADVDTHVSPVG